MGKLVHAINIKIMNDQYVVTTVVSNLCDEKISGLIQSLDVTSMHFFDFIETHIKNSLFQSVPIPGGGGYSL